VVVRDLAKVEARVRFPYPAPSLEIPEKNANGCHFWAFCVGFPRKFPWLARNEEKLLAAKFGYEYRAYKARTWF
jgi:hypothetical protein